MAKLCSETVNMIRSAVGTQREIAAEFGMSQSQVQRIRAGESWTC